LVCVCSPGWIGSDCSTASGTPPKKFADLAELKLAVMACSKEDPTCGACPRTEAVYGLFSDWDVSGVTDMSGLFRGLASFNGNVSKWNTGKVTNMSYMFFYAYAFNQDISSWDTSKVTDMTAMFMYTQSFWQDISGWSMASITTTHNMWYGSYLDVNSDACTASLRPSCTSGIV